jgi:GDPmannose 4,6-dehydratase
VKYLITGGNGQDGLILSNILLHQNNHVICVNREVSQKSSEYNLYRNKIIESIKKFTTQGTYQVTNCDTLQDVYQVLEQVKPDVILHFAAIHGSSISMPTDDKSIEQMYRVHFYMTKLFVEYLINNKDKKLLIAGSSKMFKSGGDPKFINETSEIEIDNAQHYENSKYQAYKVMYEARKKNQINAGMLFLFNHESPLRNPSFLSRTISLQLAKIIKGEIHNIQVNNIDARIDLSDARDVCQWIVNISKLNVMSDFVIGSGGLTHIRESINKVSKSLGLILPESYSKTKENVSSNLLISDISKLKSLDSFQPTRKFEDTLKEMVINDLMI